MSPEDVAADVSSSDLRPGGQGFEPWLPHLRCVKKNN